MKIVEQLIPTEQKKDFKTLYLRYRAGRLKHQYWLWNRKHKNNFVVDSYDAEILKNCQPGNTVFFASSGYYLREIWSDIDVIEMHPVVKEFYKDVVIVSDRSQLSSLVKKRYDNFAVVNNRGDHWTTVNGLTQQLQHYSSILNPGARIFYSFRDTQIQFNRLIVNLEEYFLHWAKSLESIGLTLSWCSIDFRKKIKDGNNEYDRLENPDTSNGNLKFWFTFKGLPWIKIE